MEEYDFVIIGAGLSGVDAAYRLQTQVPDSSYIVLEAQDKIGGTWAFFNFPGIRSDSQLTLFGLPWRPWVHEKDMADAHLIREYIEEAAQAEGIDRKIQFRHQVTGVSWSSEEQRWTLTAGYYDYNNALKTEIPGIDSFQGTVAHPQFWPPDLDYTDKKVVIIGSGATAITMLPEVAKTASHVTMLQRSPSYVLSLPLINPVGTWVKNHLPASIAHWLNWWRCFIQEHLFVFFNLLFPNLARRLIMFLMRKQLPETVPVDVHFNPRYKPFDQRLGLCPDGDFFKALHRDNCDIVTDHIKMVTPGGITTMSGVNIEADIIVTATGLHVHLLGGITPVVDGKPVDLGSSYAWRGAMLTGMPNAGAVIGYTINSWTLGADASIKLLIKIWKHMRKIGATSVVPVYDQCDVNDSKPVVSHSSTYFVAAQGRLPRITGQSPWYGRKNSVYDHFKLWFGSVTKGLRYTVPSKKDQ
ncbi:FAD/NAD(P)-binding domain-containing protein [Whalleya microplaca]|nr:FAD/NAD(P)-binding domain-containing protein [Whalleya microplaca]